MQMKSRWVIWICLGLLTVLSSCQRNYEKAQSYVAIDAIENRAPSKILFGSCSHQDKSLPILNSVIADQPDLFVFLGDNIYGDTEDMEELSNKYEKLGRKKEFQALRANAPTIAIWDDHDYGENDAGQEYPMKEASREIMLDFWKEPVVSPRRSRDSGIYTSYFLGDAERNVHIIMPDLRWNRPPLNHVTEEQYKKEKEPKKMGPYLVHQDPNASMLGEAQWLWLEQELLKPAKVKIIASSLQLIPMFTGWESWANFPHDRNRLMNFIRENQINSVIVISGDTHWGELSKLSLELDEVANAVQYPLWEVTSSGLSEEWKDVSPNQYRVNGYTHDVNYGFIEIDWQQSDPIIHMGLRNIDGEEVQSIELMLSTISPFKQERLLTDQ